MTPYNHKYELKYYEITIMCKFIPHLSSYQSFYDVSLSPSSLTL